MHFNIYFTETVKFLISFSIYVQVNCVVSGGTTLNLCFIHAQVLYNLVWFCVFSLNIYPSDPETAFRFLSLFKAQKKVFMYLSKLYHEALNMSLNCFGG